MRVAKRVIIKPPYGMWVSDRLSIGVIYDKQHN